MDVCPNDAETSEDHLEIEESACMKQVRFEDVDENSMCKSCMHDDEFKGISDGEFMQVLERWILSNEDEDT